MEHTSVYRRRSVRYSTINLPNLRHHPIHTATTQSHMWLLLQEPTRNVLPPLLSGVRVTSPATNAPRAVLLTAPPPTNANRALSIPHGKEVLRLAKRTNRSALRIKSTTVNQADASRKSSASPIRSTMWQLVTAMPMALLDKSDCVLLSLPFGMPKPSIAKNAASRLPTGTWMRKSAKSVQ